MKTEWWASVVNRMTDSEIAAWSDALDNNEQDPGDFLSALDVVVQTEIRSRARQATL